MAVTTPTITPSSAVEKRRAVMSTDTLHTAVAELFDALADAWNRADPAAYGDLFTEDADFVEIRGGHHVGRPAIAHGHQALWESIYAGSVVRYSVEAVRPLSDRHGVGIIGATMVAPTGPLAGTNHARLTTVVTNEGGTWHIASFHNTLVLGAPAVP